MTDSRLEETQQELFGQFSNEPKKPERLAGINKSQKPVLFSTSVEQIVLAVIILVLAGCFIFFLGVLRGRATASSPGGASGRQGAPPLPVSATASSRPSPANAAPSTATTMTVTPPAAVRKSLTAQVPARDVSKPYTIQLIAYKKRELADQEAAALRRSGYVSSIVPSGDYYQVCVGQYTNMEEAKKDLKWFGARYKDRFLRRR